MSEPPALPRILPMIDDDNRAFWTGGRDGALMIGRCAGCGYYVHPPVPFCPRCESRNVAPEPVSGRGKVFSFTVNHKAWLPGLEAPFVLALVAIDEQPDVRLVANIVDCPIDDVTFGMPVEVLFEAVEDLWVPLFRPVTAT